MKTISFSLLVLAGLGIGCATDSSDDILLGQWGGGVLGIHATPSSVVVSMPCGATGTLSTPVSLDDEGGFEIQTVMHQMYGDYGITLEGRKAGRFLRVEVYTSRPGSEPPRYLLVNGVTPDFTAYLCPAATR
jgi:hypothetical protein